MKRWQWVVLLTLALVLLMGGSALLLVPVLWLLGFKVIDSVARERPLKAAVRLVIASFAAVGYLIVIDIDLVRITPMQALRFSPWELLVGLGPIPLSNYAGSNPFVLTLQWLSYRTGFWLVAMLAFALSCLLIYWLEDTYMVVPLEGLGRTILRAILSLLLASFAAIGFGIVFVVASFLAHPVEGPINFGLDGMGSSLP